MNKNQVIQKEGEPEVPAEIIAQSIEKCAQGFDRMKKSGLSDRAIVALLKDATGMGAGDIKTVLAGLESLRRYYLVKKK